MEDMISRKALCEYALNQKDKSITPNDIMRFPSAQPETHEERTETHACDLISRQAAMEEISKQQTYKMFEGEDTLYLDANDVGSVLASLPSAQPDLSEYSDKLWKAAYERGKAEALDEIIHCKDCKHWKDSDGVYRRGIGAESKCPVNIRVVYEGNFYCADAERRTNEGD